MSPLRVIVCVWILTFVVGSRESPISCQLNGQQLRYNQTIHYEYGNQSIVVCKVPKKFALEHGVTNTSGMLKKTHEFDDNHHVIGIPLSHAPDYVQLHTVRSDDTVGRGFRLNFVGSPGHQPEMCRVVMPNTSTKAQSSSKVQNGPIQCWLNDVPLMDHSTIYVTKGCQLNIIKCSVDQTDLLGNFRPQHRHESATWIRYDGTVPPHIVLLQLKDIISDSATSTEVRMNAVLRSTMNVSPFPFVFTVLNEITDPATTTSDNNITATTPATTPPQMPTVSVNSNNIIGMKPAKVAGIAVAAVIGGLLIMVVVIVAFVVVITRRGKTKQPQVDANKLEGGTGKDNIYDGVHNQSDVNMLPNN